MVRRQKSSSVNLRDIVNMYVKDVKNKDIVPSQSFVKDIVTSQSFVKDIVPSQSFVKDIVPS